MRKVKNGSSFIENGAELALWVSFALFAAFCSDFPYFFAPKNSVAKKRSAPIGMAKPIQDARFQPPWA